MSDLPLQIRRVVTGHDSNGKAVVWKDDTVEAKPVSTVDGASARFAHIFTTDSMPYDNSDSRDLALGETGNKLANESGTILRVVDCPPNSVSPFHRTQSLDFGIITEGECNLILDDGVEIPMRKGDVCVQRGTIHGWNNVTDKWARIYFILQASKPLVIQGVRAHLPAHECCSLYNASIQQELGDAGYKMVDGQVIL